MLRVQHEQPERLGGILLHARAVFIEERQLACRAVSAVLESALPPAEHLRPVRPVAANHHLPRHPFLRLGILLLRRLAQPFHGGFGVLLHAQAEIQMGEQMILRLRIALLRGGAVQLARTGRVLFHAATVGIAIGQPRLRPRLSRVCGGTILLRCLSEPFLGGVRVLIHAPTDLVANAQIELRVGKALLRRLAKPLRFGFEILLHAHADLAALRQPVLGFPVVLPGQRLNVADNGAHFSLRARVPQRPRAAIHRLHIPLRRGQLGHCSGVAAVGLPLRRRENLLIGNVWLLLRLLFGCYSLLLRRNGLTAAQARDGRHGLGAALHQRLGIPVARARGALLHAVAGLVAAAQLHGSVRVARLRAALQRVHRALRRIFGRGNGLCNRLLGLRLSRRRRRFFLSDEPLQEAVHVQQRAQPVHVHALQAAVQEIPGQLLRGHPAIERHQPLARARIDLRQKAPPLAAHPGGFKVLRAGAHHQHDLRGGNRMVDRRLVVRAQQAGQRLRRIEHPVIQPGQLGIQVLRQHAVHRAAAVGRGLLVADEHVVGRLLVLQAADLALDGVDVAAVGLVLGAHLRRRQLAGALEFRLAAEGAGAIHPAGGIAPPAVIALVDHAVFAQQKAPAGLMLVEVLLQHAMIQRRGGLKLAVGAQLVGALHAVHGLALGLRPVVDPRARRTAHLILSIRKEDFRQTVEALRVHATDPLFWRQFQPLFYHKGGAGASVPAPPGAAFFPQNMPGRPMQPGIPPVTPQKSTYCPGQDGAKPAARPSAAKLYRGGRL